MTNEYLYCGALSVKLTLDSSRRHQALCSGSARRWEENRGDCWQNTNSMGRYVWWGELALNLPGSGLDPGIIHCQVPLTTCWIQNRSFTGYWFFIFFVENTMSMSLAYYSIWFWKIICVLLVRQFISLHHCAQKTITFWLAISILIFAQISVWFHPSNVQ